MKRKLALCAAVLCLTMALAPSALAAESVVVTPVPNTPEVCYPTSVSRSEDGTEIRKYYDLSRRTIPPVSPAPTSSRMGTAIPSSTCSSRSSGK